MAGNGSPLFELTWRETDMPSGPPISQLQASARHTSGKGFGGWPTPRAEERQQQNSGDQYVALSKAVLMAGWVSPTAMDGNRGSMPSRLFLS
jgi:hypothetical protein